jgi:hypothetical protein
MESLTTAEAFDKLNVDQLKALVPVLGEKPPQRKGELVEVLAQAMQDPCKVRALYEGLDETSKKAIQEAVHDDEGELHLAPFAAKHRSQPDFGRRESHYRAASRPTALALFFPDPYRHVLPGDLKDLLEDFVPEPPPVAISAADELPATISQRSYSWTSGRHVEEKIDVPLRVRATAADALHDVKAVLQLVDAGAIRVSEKLRQATPAVTKTLAEVLQGGDFYSDDDVAADALAPADDLLMKPFAWPLLVQAAGLAVVAGSQLRLTPAGRKATAEPAAAVLRAIWKKWLDTTLLDEFNRVDVIKGRKGNLTAVAERRHSVVEVLEQCPPGKWLSVDEIFRLLQGLAPDLQVARDPWKLYLCEARYGSLGYDGDYSWELVQGRYVLAFLFEYAATLGMIDVAFISPESARHDFAGRWGADDLSCLSRYDGLQIIRINPLGAWCLGLADRFEPEPVTVEPLVRVLPNLDIVAGDRPLPAADVLMLNRFAERVSDAVWHLDPARVLKAVAEGQTVASLTEFLTAKCTGPLPQTVETFLDDVQRKSQLLRDCGTARLIECADAVVARTLAHDRLLRGLCQLAGERFLVFRVADEKAVRRNLRELGYVLPPQE